MIALAVVIRSDRNLNNWRRFVLGLGPQAVKYRKQSFGDSPWKPQGAIEVQTAQTQASLNRLTRSQVASAICLDWKQLRIKF